MGGYLRDEEKTVRTPSVHVRVVEGDKRNEMDCRFGGMRVLR